jgi:hypothetical protein
MTIHFIRITIVTLLIVALMFSPYIPGDYDSFSLTLSAMAQLSSFVGLLLVPIGMLWLIYKTVKRNKIASSNKIIYRFALTAFVVSCIVGLATVIAAFADGSRSLGIIMIAVYIYIAARFIVKMRKLKMQESSGFNSTPFYLICIPTIAVLVRFIFIPGATEFSRNHAIKHSEQLIQHIEAYHAKNGHYPISLHSVWEDYEPGIAGIKRFYYEPSGNAYNLYFEQFAAELDIKEIVMYNKLDEQDFSSHNSDLLVLTPEEIKLQRGYVSATKLQTPHWKYFSFD